ncbi:MAG TPA: hypothetical protein VIL36_06585, partial [Acidimicrobiales bacterium]
MGGATSQGRGQERVRAGAGARALRDRAERGAAGAAALLTAAEKARDEARAAYEVARDAAVRDEMARLPLARLRDVTDAQLQLGPLEAVGYRTVASVAGVRVGRLQVIKGVGADTAAQVVAGAYAVRRSL